MGVNPPTATAATGAQAVTPPTKERSLEKKYFVEEAAHPGISGNASLKAGHSLGGLKNWQFTGDPVAST